MTKKTKKSVDVSISVTPKVYKELEEKKYNKNKLIISLLEKYLQKDKNN